MTGFEWLLRRKSRRCGGQAASDRIGRQALNQAEPLSRCVVCSSTDSVEIGQLPDDRCRDLPPHPLAECRSCGHWFLRKSADLDDSKALHVAAYSTGDLDAWDRLYVRLRRSVFQSRWFRLWVLWDADQYFLGPAPDLHHNRMLDFGCFEGRLLPHYKRRGYMVAGVDFNPLAADIARGTGIEVHDRLPEDSTFDVIVLCGVIEHFDDPAEELKRLSDVLAPLGRIRISCPNRDSLFRKLFGSAWANWHAPFHQHFFSAGQITSILNGAGLEVENISTVSPSVDLMRSVLVALRLQKNTRTPKPYFAVPLILAFITIFKPLLFLINRFGAGDCLRVEGRLKPSSVVMKNQLDSFRSL